MKKRRKKQNQFFQLAVFPKRLIWRGSGLRTALQLVVWWKKHLLNLLMSGEIVK